MDREIGVEGCMYGLCCVVVYVCFVHRVVIITKATNHVNTSLYHFRIFGKLKMLF